jgi:hypothetical protein
MEAKTISLTYHITERHGYIEVSLSLLRKLKISKLISEYSKTLRRTVFVEEDGDATLLTKRLKLEGYEVILKESERRKQDFFDCLPKFNDAHCRDKQFAGFTSDYEFKINHIVTLPEKYKVNENVLSSPDEDDITIEVTFSRNGQKLKEQALERLGIKPSLFFQCESEKYYED